MYVQKYYNLTINENNIGENINVNQHSSMASKTNQPDNNEPVIPQSEVFRPNQLQVPNNDAEIPTTLGSFTNQDGLRRSSRLNTESLIAENAEYDSYYDILHQEDYKIQDQMQNPISFVATSNKDTMY